MVDYFPIDNSPQAAAAIQGVERDTLCGGGAASFQGLLLPADPLRYLGNEAATVLQPTVMVLLPVVVDAAAVRMCLAVLGPLLDD